MSHANLFELSVTMSSNTCFYQDNTVVLPPATLLYGPMLIEWGKMTTLFMVPSGLFSPYSSLCCFLVCLTFLEEGS